MPRKRFTPCITRKYLHTVRKKWREGNAHKPFMFTGAISADSTIEAFCVDFVMHKYMRGRKN